MQSKLIEAVRNKSVDQVTSALKECPDLSSVLDDALLESVLGGNDKIRELIMNSYPDETTREAAVEQVAADLTQKVEGVRKRHKELIARRILKELAGPPLEL